MGLIEFVSRFLHQYLVVCVALAIIPLKFFMVRLSKDREGEADTLLAIPEDLCYVTLGLLLSTMTSDAALLRKFFSNSPYPRTNGAVLIAINFLLAGLVHKIASSWAKPQYQTWRAALEIRINHSHLDDDEGLALRPEEDNLLYIVIHHFSKLLFSILLQLLFSGYWLYWIGRIYGTR